MTRNSADTSNQPTEKSTIARLLPVMVVFVTVSCFMGLAWYAYHTGSQSLNEDELLVVEADKTPVKEKPTDPGGMQFPNQDKTIFETFSSGGQQQPKVERVLPTPEQPMAKKIDTSETKTWINEKLHKQKQENAGLVIPADKPIAEQVIGGENKSPEDEKILESTVSSEQVEAKHAETEDIATAKPVALEPVAEKPVTENKAAEENTSADKKPVEEKVKTEEEVVENKAVDEKPAVEKKTSDEKKALEKSSTQVIQAGSPVNNSNGAKSASKSGAYKVQLGAYRSEKEAQDAWKKMKSAHKEFTNMQPVIVKADLGEKGVYYRLRTGAFASTSEAKAFCGTMTILGRACILPSE